MRQKRNTKGITAASFRAFIAELVRTRYGTQDKLAQALGISQSAFSRAVKAKTLSVANCLKLAQETGESTGKVLRLAGKADVANLIEAMHGKSLRRLTADDRYFVELPADVKRQLRRFVEGIRS